MPQTGQFLDSDIKRFEKAHPNVDVQYETGILKEDYSPGFFAKHFLKDLGIALDEAERMRLFLPATLQAKKLYETLCDDGFADDGTQALIKLYWNLPNE